MFHVEQLTDTQRLQRLLSELQEFANVLAQEEQLFIETANKMQDKSSGLRRHFLGKAKQAAEDRDVIQEFIERYF